MLDFEKFMHPIGGQICGSKPEMAGACAKIIEDLGFDVVDLNCGCPVDKVTKDGSGSAMLKMPQKIGEIISNMVGSQGLSNMMRYKDKTESDKMMRHNYEYLSDKHGRIFSPENIGKYSAKIAKICEIIQKVLY